MSAVRSTFDSTDLAPLQVIPRLTPREVDSTTAAVAFGDWVGVLDLSDGRSTPGCGEIVGVVTPAIAEQLTKPDEKVEQLRRELDEASKELDTLRTIIGEVFAESEPSDHRWKLDDAATDAAKAVKYASDTAEEL